jgi:hypothetical protein
MWVVCLKGSHHIRLFSPSRNRDTKIPFKLSYLAKSKLKLNSVASVRELTIPPERPPLVGEVSANFCGYRVQHGQCNRSPQPYSRISRPEPLLFLPSSFSIVFTRLGGPHYFSENLVAPGIEPRTSGSVARNSDH